MADFRDLRISVIGAGMGGLASALCFARKGFKNIDVYETASNLGFVGAGIQLAPNMLRILDRLGCWEGSQLQREATTVLETKILDGPTNSELVHVVMADVKDKYGYPHCTGHRASLAGGLYEACQKEAGVTFHFATSLERVDSFGPGRPKITVKHRDGDEKTFETDVLIGADGIKSTLRYAMLRELKIDAEVEDTGQACYRIMLPREKMEPYPELLELLDAKCAMRWIGEKRHIVAYPIAGHTIYNLSTCQPDTNFAAATNATYTTKGDKSEMKKVYVDFCPLVQQMLEMVPEGEVCEWRLRSHKVLSQWTLGSAALLGDACHPTLPHMAQGAAMAIEDAAVLAEVVSLTPGAGVDPEALAKSLRVYELLRKETTWNRVEMAAFSGRTLHLGEGEAKQERDQQFAMAKQKGAPVPDKWASPEVQQAIYSHDCMKEAADKFSELYSSLA
ncbi:hypothetical protein PG988_013175 [Apiospora saccharicola]